MLKIQQEVQGLHLQADHYQLRFPTDRPFVMLEDAAGHLLLELFPFSSVHPLNGRDDTYETEEWQFRELPEGVEVWCKAHSSGWQGKSYHFHCYPQRLRYHIEVEGEGPLAEVLYFGGYYSESLRWSSGFFWSGQRFSQVFNPEPNIPETFHHPAAANTRIDLMGVPIPAKGDWFFTPPPFCLAGQLPDERWLALGVEARPGSNQFTSYHYHGSLGAFHLSLDYEGQTQVRGHYRLPAIGLDFAPDEYAALSAHVDALRAAGHSPLPQATPPDWWRSPIFCGWGAQCYLAARDQGHAPNYARQEHYESWLERLEQEQVAPGIVVLDDKWQASYGGNRVDTQKWPDLPGFIKGQHQQGRKVLLWLKAWDPEGIPVEECITNAGGIPIAVDPSNPAYERRLREAVREMLSPEGYDADGFKLDFTARIPSGYGLRHYGERWGLELMKRFLSILYTEAKQAKADALIMTHTPHPYLADVLDMIRLNDINLGQDVNRAMQHRARVAALACPQAIIDTDNWPITDKAAWRAYLEIQPQLGVPSLYYATHLDSTQEALNDDDYALIRRVWAQVRGQHG